MVRVVICGSGFIGRIHSMAYKNLPDAKLAGVMGASEKAGKLAAELGVRTYKSLDEVLRDDSVDMLDVCVPTFLHREFVERGLAAGKHVLCEKPMAVTLEDAAAIMEAVERAGTFFMIAHNHRFYVENVFVQEAAASGKLGKILCCSAYRLGVTPDWSEGGWINEPSKSGGAATDLILHDIDLCNWIGGKPKLVMAQGIRSKLGAWDYMDISIDYEGGVKGFVEGGSMLKGQWPFTQEHRILGEAGTAQWISRMGKNIENRATAQSTIGLFLEGQPAYFHEWKRRDPYEIEIEYFLNCIKENKSPEIVRPIDGFRALQVSVAAKQSAETLLPVKIEEI
jgi:Predicted dehydrogenases and related proteins